MNKEAALARLAALESEAKSLRDILETPEPPKNNARLPAIIDEKGSDNPFGALFHLDGSHFDFKVRDVVGEKEVRGQNYFHDASVARRYADAFSVLLELRRQPGVVPAKDCRQWMIRMTSTGDLNIVDYAFFHSKSGRLSPAFESRGAAGLAVANVGAENIRAAINTLSGNF